MDNTTLIDYQKRNTGLRILSSNALKLIACVSMLIDHTGLILMDNNRCMRAVGRLAFPIFAFLIVQGLLHTSDVRRYIGRLLIFAVLSEIPFDLAVHDSLWYPGAQNIFFTLVLGLFVIYTFETAGPLRRWAPEIAFVSALAAEFLRFDYGMVGIGTILLFYWCEKQSEPSLAIQRGQTLYFGKRQNIELIIVSTLMYVLCIGVNQLYALLALIPINMYNGRRGRVNLKYMFYLFYPLHLLLLWHFRLRR